MSLPYDLRTQLGSIGTAWLNAPPADADPPPFMVVYLVTRELLTNDGQYAYDFRIDCVGESFVQAKGLADGIILKDDWPWPLVFQSEKDEYNAPSDGGDVIHVVSVNLQIVE